MEGQGKVTGKGGWGLMQNTDWAMRVCGCAQKRRRPSFSKASTVPELPASTLPPRSAAPQQLFVNRRPFHALVAVAEVTPQFLSQSAAAAVWRSRQMQTAGIDPQTRGGAAAGAGHLRLSLCPGRTRSFWGNKNLVCLNSKASQSLSR